MKSLITKRSQRIITIIIALVLLLNCSTFTSAKQIEPAKGQLENESIIRADLREAMDLASEDELIPVWICLKSIDPDELDTMVLEKTGFDPKIYEDTALFNKYVLPEIEEAVKKGQRQDEDPLRNAADYVLAEIDPKQAKEGLIKKAMRDRIEDYNQQKRNVRWEEYSRRNTEFLEKALAKREDRNVILCSPFTPTIVIEATKSEIEILAQNEMVESLCYYVNCECEPAMYDALSQTGVYCEGGTGYDQPGMWSALTGAGVKIGVLETSSTTNGYGGRFDANAPQLSGNTNLHFIDNYYSGIPVPYVIDSHATKVVSIIAGQSILYNGNPYRGIVPDATIYQTPVTNSDNVLTGIYNCLQYGVSILNMSFSLAETGSYYSMTDWLIDYVVREENVVVIVSAGNFENGTWKVKSPGRALSAVTVGNAETKTYSNEVLSAPYSIHITSCYSEESYYPNKPDLVAPGCFNVLMNDLNGLVSPEFIVGTSFSAPIVTGIAAQIIENYPQYILKPMVVKALLLVGADLSQMNVLNDTPTTAFVYDKCGAGMVNAINSVDNVNLDFLGQVPSSMSSGIVYHFNAGDRVRAVMTFSKNNNNYISSTSHLDDYDLLLVKQDSLYGNQLIDYCSSNKNNNEIVDVTIPEDGDYYFIMYRNNVADYTHRPTICVVFKCFT